jgi:hypothetical protein
MLENYHKEKAIEARVAGSKAAREIVESGLLVWEDGHGADFAERFLEVLKELLPKTRASVLLEEAAKADAKPKPIARLGATVLEYGEFRGRTYDEVPKERLDWYLARAEENVASLKAYLKHPEFEGYRRGLCY